MEELITTISATKTEELIRARIKYGHEFNSPHEAFGVISEEIDEADQEGRWINYEFKEILPNLHDNDLKQQTNIYERIEKHAIMLAAEAVQVAAMCEKARESQCMKEE